MPSNQKMWKTEIGIMDRALGQMRVLASLSSLTLDHSDVMVDQVYRQGGVVFSSGIGLYERQRQVAFNEGRGGKSGGEG